MPTEKKLTGYPSIDKPWLKYYPQELLSARPSFNKILNRIKKEGTERLKLFSWDKTAKETETEAAQA